MRGLSCKALARGREQRLNAAGMRVLKQALHESTSLHLSESLKAKRCIFVISLKGLRPLVRASFLVFRPIIILVASRAILRILSEKSMSRSKFGNMSHRLAYPIIPYEPYPSIQIVD